MAAKDLSALRVVVVASNANTRFGGEAILPVHYFRFLRARGADAHLVCHERNREDLAEQFPDEGDRLHFTADRRTSRALERLGGRLPRNVTAMTVWVLMGSLAAVDLRRTARRLVAEAPGRSVVHEPIPVSPRQPSLMSDVGAPVVVGPLNGGMSYPDGFTHDVRRSERLVRWALRQTSDVLNRLVDGKGRAAVVLVANQRTRRALPRTARRGRVVELAENGVDLTTFTARSAPPAGAPRFAFVGRLVDWKRVDLLLDALTRLPEHYRLDVVGTGPLAADLRRRAAEQGLAERVVFHGLLPQQRTAEVLAACDGLVLPSVYECGGAVVLEAMAVGLPVVATDWGGPADYVVHGETGLLVAPDSPERLTAGLAEGMRRLGEDRELGRRMGRAGRARVEARFDWQRKIDVVSDVYLDVTRA